MGSFLFCMYLPLHCQRCKLTNKEIAANIFAENYKVKCKQHDDTSDILYEQLLV